MISSKYLILSLLLIVTLALGGWDGVGSEDENGLVLRYAFAIPTIGTDPVFHSLYGSPGNDFAFYMYTDVGEIVITPVVTSNIVGSNLNYTWVPFGEDVDTLGVNATSTLQLTNFPDDYSAIHYTLYAFDEEDYSVQHFEFHVDVEPIINITSSDSPRNISVGDSFVIPEIACIYPVIEYDIGTVFEPDTIDTSTESRHIIKYTCNVFDNFPAVTKSLIVNVGNPPPPSPLSLSVTPSSVSVFEDGIITLASSHTGGDGTPLTYSWSSNPDTAGVLSSTSTQNSTFTAPAVDRNTSYVITLEANDGTYRDSTTVRIIVGDDPAPTVRIPGPNPLIIDYIGTYTPPDVMCHDNGDVGTITPVPSTSSIDTSVPGDTLVTFTCTDSKGQEDTATLTVRVNQPENAPTVTIAGSNPLRVPYDANNNFTEPAVTCVDHQGNARTGITTSGDTVDTSTPGSYAITYTCTDSNGPGAKTLTVIVGEKPPTITQKVFNPVVERTNVFTPSDVVKCSDAFNDDIRVTHQGINTQTADIYPVTFTCTSPTTRLSAEPVTVDVLVTDTQPPEFLSAKYTPKTGMLIITFNEELAPTTNSSAFTIRSQDKTSGDLILIDATLTTQNRAITIALTDDQKETFQTISGPHLFIAANTIYDTADSPNVTDEITDKRISIAVKKKSGNSTPPPIVDLNALKSSSFDVDIPDSVLDILESYDQSSPIEPIMEGEIIFSFPFVTDGAYYALGGNVNTIQPYQIGLHQQTSLTFTAYSSTNIDHFVMFLNLNGDNISYTLSDTYITYLNGRVTVTDPHNYIADAAITIEQDEEQSFQYNILTVIEFDGEVGLTNMVARIWNDGSRATVIQITDALNIVSITEQSSELVEEETTTTTTTATALATPAPNTESISDDDIIHSLKMWAGFDSQSMSDSELLDYLKLDYPDADIPNWMMAELAVLVISDDLTVDEFNTALVFVLDAL